MRIPSLSAPRRLLRAATVLLVLASAACQDAHSSRAQFVPGGDAEQGRRLIAQYGCGGCHHVPGVPGAYGRVGPSFTGFADRTYIAGSVRNEPAQVVDWIRFPQRVRPGTAMPTLGVTEADAGDIAAYLYTLGRGGLGPPRLLPSSTLPEH